MIGTAYFKDGHTEEILEANVTHLDFGAERIEFLTESGRYFYQSWYEFPETLYCDNNPLVQLTHENFRHKFYKLEFEIAYSITEGRFTSDGTDPRVIEVPIEKIELLEEKKR